MASTKIVGLPRVIILGGIALIFGCTVSLGWHFLMLEQRVEAFPANYRLPRIPGGIPLRMAMIHDVIHERYLKHGTAWYETRNTQARAVIAVEEAKDGAAPEKFWDAYDDLAVGLERLHQSDAAAEVMRKKLALLPPLPASATQQVGDPNDERAELQRIIAAQSMPMIPHHHYTAHANLGTFLIHGSFAGAAAGDAKAKAQLAEGLAHIEQSIALNPAAHSGRENWQAIAVRHFLTGIDDPEFLTKYDMVGNDMSHITIGSAGTLGLAYPLADFDAPRALDKRIGNRETIKKVGLDPKWREAVHPAYNSPRPFDEPVLGLLGMWTLGGGPNPNSALALGHIAEQVGQLEIAWNAYERALEMQDRFSPREDVRKALVEHCLARQRAIAEIKARTDDWSGPMRQKHRDELAWGEQYQKDYQAFEAKQIAAGVALDDPHFYDAFFAGRASIASDPGRVDDVEVVYKAPHGMIDALPTGLLAAGVVMMLGAFMTKQRGSTA